MFTIFGKDVPAEEYENQFRPTEFDDFIGNKELVDKINIAIEGSQKRGDPLTHILIGGPAGTGKTTIANIAAKKLSTDPKIVTCTAIETISDMVQLLIGMPEGGVLFLDECHALNKKIEEQMYPALEDFKIDLKKPGLIGKKSDIISVPLKPFCVIGATTRMGAISDPLRDRFGIVHTMDYYNIEELCQILNKNIEKLSINIDNQETLVEISKRARGIPRVALRLLGRVRDFADAKNNGLITKKVVEDSMEIEQIDERGLTKLDYKYLESLFRIYKGGPTGIQALAASMNEDNKTLSETIEPFLLREGLVTRSPRGRLITDYGLDYINEHST